jgi:hypothetical protein
MKYLIAGLALVLGIIVLVVVIGLLLAFPVMWLVNFLFAPSALLVVFGTVKLGFWQAYGLLVLAGLLFKSSSTTGSK